MATITRGRIDWKGSIDKDGHREYTARYLVQVDAGNFGPRTVFDAPLPAVGSGWYDGVTTDSWAQRIPTMRATPVVTKEKGTFWIVELKWSSKTEDMTRCQTTSPDNPLTEPPKISGSFTKYTRELTVDQNDTPIMSSSKELYRGAAVEFDENRPQVVIQMNVGTLPLTTFSQMVNTVNNSALWGIAAGKVKLSDVSWERKLWGTCTYYYTVTYVFDIKDDDTGFMLLLIDEGSKVLKDGGNPLDPTDYDIYKDENGENARVLLDGLGSALEDSGSPVTNIFEVYSKSNFLTLGIPTTL